MAESFASALQWIPGVTRVVAGAALAPLTTFRTGGPADWLVDVASGDALAAVVALAGGAGQPLTMLGGGSNVLIGDRGIRGVVVRARLTSIEAVDGGVRAGAGVTINGLVRWTVGRGLAGLEAWAGTPGTVGGAIYGNAHYGGRNIGDLVRAVGLVDREGQLTQVVGGDLAFNYDTSRLQWTRERVVWAEFALSAGVPDALRAVARASLAHRKRTQPLDVPSAGCVFRNPEPDDPVPDGLPRSAGALVDRAGLKGHRVGGAAISPVHANFIVTDGTASSADIRALVETARNAVRAQFGVALRDEIVMLGDF